MKRRHHLVLAIAAACLTLTGCGDKYSAATADVGEQSGAEPVGATALISSTSTIEMVTAVAKARRSHVDIAIDADGRKFTAAGYVDGGSSRAGAKADLSLDLGMGPMEIRLLDRVAYINLGPLSSGKFTRIDFADAGNPMGAEYGKIIGQLDPSKVVTQLEGAVSPMTKKGKPVQIDGVEAQPYTIELDTGKVAGLSGHRSGAKVPKSVVVLVYVGPDNLPRRISSTVAGSATTVDFSEWGEQVKIAAPSKDEITDKSFLDQLDQMPKQ